MEGSPGRTRVTALFVDTSAWYPLADAGHPDHQRLANILEEHVQRRAAIVTSNLIVGETHALLLRRAGRLVALDFVRSVHQPPMQVEFSTPARQETAVTKWLGSYCDQDFSLADAVSFTIMQELGIREALALDRHFSTAGFIRVC